jgi:hypothetical protein
MLKLIAGNHNDLFDIKVHFEDITSQLTNSGIPVSELVINADFDSQKFRKIFSDKEIITVLIIKMTILMNNYTKKEMLLKE